MSIFKKTKDTLFRVLFDCFPSLLDMWIRRTSFVEAADVPWTPMGKPLSECRVALLTTAGVHRKDQRPFDMADPQGDATFREFPTDTPKDSLMITHDYYNHSDADHDINVVIPVDRLLELEAEKIVGEAAPFCYSFMGHILGKHLYTLIGETAPEVARRLKEQGVDLVFLTPG